MMIKTEQFHNWQCTKCIFLEMPLWNVEDIVKDRNVSLNHTNSVDIDIDLILTLSETWLSENICNSLLQIDGYHFERLDRDEKGGGVGCFIQKNISYIRRPDLEDRELEIMWLEIRLHNHKPKYLGVVYRPPNSRSVFFNNLEINLENICMLSNDIVILGDLNCNMLTQNNLSKQIHDLSDNMHLSQLIRTPTRITVNSTNPY